MYLTTCNCDSCDKTNVHGVMYELNETPVLFLCAACAPMHYQELSYEQEPQLAS